MGSRYVAWLKSQGVSLFNGGGTEWRLYHKALVPAPIAPYFAEISEEEARALLKESHALFIRYASSPSEEKTEWWYVTCDAFDLSKISSKARQNIRRGNRECHVRRVETDWLAVHGYECFVAAHKRYKHAKPISGNEFRENILRTLNGPFEHWGVFKNNALTGYSQCVVDGNDVVMNTTKYDPTYLRDRTAYALIHGLISHYVVDNEMTLSNGTRSVAHDTNYQSVLISMGFRMKFCQLNLVYEPWLKFVVRALFPLRRLCSASSRIKPIHMINSLLFQEQLARGN